MGLSPGCQAIVEEAAMVESGCANYSGPKLIHTVQVGVQRLIDVETPVVHARRNPLRVSEGLRGIVLADAVIDLQQKRRSTRNKGCAEGSA